MASLDIDVSHPWEGKNPVRLPKRNDNTLPTTNEVIEVLKYLLDNEPEIIYHILTEYEIEDFMSEGKIYI